ncbi:DUF397 domain-containing protein [Pseudonocardia sp. S2-4]|uniref:DUF397 domain-containing protein n=1 Tax=Pseudonocardia humida TaxID=2800819 RepID=A0ABT1A315_9PSEU|nr:DUF397 domain-containing protein [Pseudonocardia humida]MCO1657392.1 DUF397 domain-containing protein [Pseudonocardia humida]
MHTDDLDWRTSTFSGGNGESCVEVAFLPDGGTAVRDTKNRALAAHRYPAAWTAFLTGIRAGDFPRS